MIRSRKFIKTISLALVVAFCAQEIGYAAPTPSPKLSSELSHPLDLVAADPSRFEAPLDFVNLKEVHKGSQNVFIIHIQDAHSNLSGQENLAKALDQIMSKYGVSLVLSEGGAEDCSLTSLKKIAPPEVWKKLAKNYLIQGKISGEEYLNLVSDHPMKIMGLEDINLYLKSVQNYAELADKRGEVLEYLKTIRHALEKLKRKMYPKELVEYERQSVIASPPQAGLSLRGGAKGADEAISAQPQRLPRASEYVGARNDSNLDHYQALLELARARGVDLSEFPQIMKLIELKLKEKLIDFNLANLEQAALVEEIRQKDIFPVIARSPAVRRGDEAISNEIPRFARDDPKNRINFLGHFQNTLNSAREKGILLTKYPNLVLFGEYLRDFSEIDLDQILDELTKVEDKVYMAVIANVAPQLSLRGGAEGDDEAISAQPQRLPRASEYVGARNDILLLRSIDRYLALLTTAYNIQMSTKEFNSFRANEPDFGTAPFLAFVNRKLAEQGYYEDLVPYKNLLEEGKKSLEAFYDSVTQRDYAFLRNTEKILKDENQKVAVLISGGYHTPHLKKLFREKGYSMAVLTPIVTSETNQKKYEKLLLEPLKKMVDSRKSVDGRDGKHSTIYDPPSTISSSDDGVRVAMIGLGLYRGMLDTLRGIGYNPRPLNDGERMDGAKFLKTEVARLTDMIDKVAAYKEADQEAVSQTRDELRKLDSEIDAFIDEVKKRQPASREGLSQNPSSVFIGARMAQEAKPADFKLAFGRATPRIRFGNDTVLQFGFIGNGEYSLKLIDAGSGVFELSGHSLASPMRLGPGVVKFGRHPTNDIVVQPASAGVFSRFQLQMNLEKGGSVIILDTYSRNFTRGKVTGALNQQELRLAFEKLEDEADREQFRALDLSQVSVDLSFISGQSISQSVADLGVEDLIKNPDDEERWTRLWRQIEEVHSWFSQNGQEIRNYLAQAPQNPDKRKIDYLYNYGIVLLDKLLTPGNPYFYKNARLRNPATIHALHGIQFIKNELELVSDVWQGARMASDNERPLNAGARIKNAEYNAKLRAAITETRALFLSHLPKAGRATQRLQSAIAQAYVELGDPGKAMTKTGSQPAPQTRIRTPAYERKLDQAVRESQPIFMKYLSKAGRALQRLQQAIARAYVALEETGMPSDHTVQILDTEPDQSKDGEDLIDTLKKIEADPRGVSNPEPVAKPIAETVESLAKELRRIDWVREESALTLPEFSRVIKPHIGRLLEEGWSYSQIARICTTTMTKAESLHKANEEYHKYLREHPFLGMFKLQPAEVTKWSKSGNDHFLTPDSIARNLGTFLVIFPEVLTSGSRPGALAPSKAGGARMADWKEKEGALRAMAEYRPGLSDILNVGPNKPIGYVGYETFPSSGTADLALEWAQAKDLKMRWYVLGQLLPRWIVRSLLVFPISYWVIDLLSRIRYVDASNFYVYDTSALQDLLNANRPLLKRTGAPDTADAFVDFVERRRVIDESFDAQTLEQAAHTPWILVNTELRSLVGRAFGHSEAGARMAPKSPLTRTSGQAVNPVSGERPDLRGARMATPTQCVTGDTLLPIVRKADSRSWMVDGRNDSTIYNLSSTIQSVPIKDVQAGDYVLSLNEETQTIEPHRIKGLMDMGVKPVFRLTTKSGRSIKTTANHPYLVRGRTQAPSSPNVFIGDQLRVDPRLRGDDRTRLAMTQGSWIRVSELRVGDEVGVPATEALIPPVGLVSDFNALDKNGLAFDVERRSVVADAESVGAGRQMDQRLGPYQRILQSGVVFQFFADLLLGVRRKVFNIFFSARRESESMHDASYAKWNSLTILSKGIQPFFWASMMDFSREWTKSGSGGSLDSIASISHPAGFTDRSWYSSDESLSTSAASILDKRSNSANVLKKKSFGTPFLSVTTAACDLLLSLPMAAGIILVSGNIFQDLNFAGTFFMIQKYTTHLGRSWNGFLPEAHAAEGQSPIGWNNHSAVLWPRIPIRGTSAGAVDSPVLSRPQALACGTSAGAVDSPVLSWDPIVSIEPLGPMQVWDIEVEGTHNFIGNGIFAHNTYLGSETDHPDVRPRFSLPKADFIAASGGRPVQGARMAKPYVPGRLNGTSPEKSVARWSNMPGYEIVVKKGGIVPAGRVQVIEISPAQGIESHLPVSVPLGVYASSLSNLNQLSESVGSSFLSFWYRWWFQQTFTGFVDTLKRRYSGAVQRPTFDLRPLDTPARVITSRHGHEGDNARLRGRLASETIGELDAEVYAKGMERDRPIVVWIEHGMPSAMAKYFKEPMRLAQPIEEGLGVSLEDFARLIVRGQENLSSEDASLRNRILDFMRRVYDEAAETDLKRGEIDFSDPYLQMIANNWIKREEQHREVLAATEAVPFNVWVDIFRQRAFENLALRQVRAGGQLDEALIAWRFARRLRRRNIPARDRALADLMESGVRELPNALHLAVRGRSHRHLTGYLMEAGIGGKKAPAEPEPAVIPFGDRDAFEGQTVSADTQEGLSLSAVERKLCIEDLILESAETHYFELWTPDMDLETDLDRAMTPIVEQLSDQDLEEWAHNIGNAGPDTIAHKAALTWDWLSSKTKEGDLRRRLSDISGARMAAADPAVRAIVDQVLLQKTADDQSTAFVRAFAAVLEQITPQNIDAVLTELRVADEKRMGQHLLRFLLIDLGVSQQMAEGGQDFAQALDDIESHYKAISPVNLDFYEVGGAVAGRLDLIQQARRGIKPGGVQVAAKTPGEDIAADLPGLSRAAEVLIQQGRVQNGHWAVFDMTKGLGRVYAGKAVDSTGKVSGLLVIYPSPDGTPGIKEIPLEDIRGKGVYEITLGRSRQSDVQVLQNLGISRLHAALVAKAEGEDLTVWVKDLGPTGGTHFQGYRIPKDGSAEILSSGKAEKTHRALVEGYPVSLTVSPTEEVFWVELFERVLSVKGLEEAVRLKSQIPNWNFSKWREGIESRARKNFVREFKTQADRWWKTTSDSILKGMLTAAFDLNTVGAGVLNERLASSKNEDKPFQEAFEWAREELKRLGDPSKLNILRFFQVQQSTFFDEALTWVGNGTAYRKRAQGLEPASDTSPKSDKRVEEKLKKVLPDLTGIGRQDLETLIDQAAYVVYAFAAGRGERLPYIVNPDRVWRSDEKPLYPDTMRVSRDQPDYDETHPVHNGVFDLPILVNILNVNNNRDPGFRDEKAPKILRQMVKEDSSGAEGNKKFTLGWRATDAERARLKTGGARMAGTTAEFMKRLGIDPVDLIEIGPGKSGVHKRLPALAGMKGMIRTAVGLEIYRLEEVDLNASAAEGSLPAFVTVTGQNAADSLPAKDRGEIYIAGGFSRWIASSPKYKGRYNFVILFAPFGKKSHDHIYMAENLTEGREAVVFLRPEWQEYEEIRARGRVGQYYVRPWERAGFMQLPGSPVAPEDLPSDFPSTENIKGPWSYPGTPLFIFKSSPQVSHPPAGARMAPPPDSSRRLAGPIASRSKESGGGVADGRLAVRFLSSATAGKILADIQARIDRERERLSTAILFPQRQRSALMAIRDSKGDVVPVGQSAVLIDLPFLIHGRYLREATIRAALEDVESILIKVDDKRPLKTEESDQLRAAERILTEALPGARMAPREGLSPKGTVPEAAGARMAANQVVLYPSTKLEKDEAKALTEKLDREFGVWTQSEAIEKVRKIFANGKNILSIVDYNAAEDFVFNLFHRSTYLEVLIELVRRLDTDGDKVLAFMRRNADREDGVVTHDEETEWERKGRRYYQGVSTLSDISEGALIFGALTFDHRGAFDGLHRILQGLAKQTPSQRTAFVSALRDLDERLARVSQWDFLNRFRNDSGGYPAGMLLLHGASRRTKDEYSKGSRKNIPHEIYFTYVPPYATGWSERGAVIAAEVPVTSIRHTAWVLSYVDEDTYEPEVKVKGSIRITEVFAWKHLKDLSAWVRFGKEYERQLRLVPNTDKRDFENRWWDNETNQEWLLDAGESEFLEMAGPPHKLGADGSAIYVALRKSIERAISIYPDVLIAATKVSEMIERVTRQPLKKILSSIQSEFLKASTDGARLTETSPPITKGRDRAGSTGPSRMTPPSPPLTKGGNDLPAERFLETFGARLVKNISPDPAAVAQRQLRLQRQTYFLIQKPEGSSTISFPLSALAESSLSALVKTGITWLGYGGSILTTMIPLVALGGYMLVFRKSESPLSSILLDETAALSTAPFLVFLGAKATSWFLVWRNEAMSRWRFSSISIRNLLAKRHELFALDALARVANGGPNGLLGQRGVAPENVRDVHPAFQKPQNGGNGHTGPLKDGPSMAKGRVNADVAIHDGLHVFSPTEKYNMASPNGQSAARAARAGSGAVDLSLRGPQLVSAPVPASAVPASQTDVQQGQSLKGKSDGGQSLEEAEPRFQSIYDVRLNPDWVVSAEGIDGESIGILARIFVSLEKSGALRLAETPFQFNNGNALIKFIQADGGIYVNLYHTGDERVGGQFAPVGSILLTDAVIEKARAEKTNVQIKAGVIQEQAPGVEALAELGRKNRLAEKVLKAVLPYLQTPVALYTAVDRDKINAGDRFAVAELAMMEASRRRIRSILSEQGKEGLVRFLFTDKKGSNIDKVRSDDLSNWRGQKYERQFMGVPNRDILSRAKAEEAGFLSFPEIPADNKEQNIIPYHSTYITAIAVASFDQMNDNVERLLKDLIGAERFNSLANEHGKAAIFDAVKRVTDPSNLGFYRDLAVLVRKLNIDLALEVVRMVTRAVGSAA